MKLKAAAILFMAGLTMASSSAIAGSLTLSGKVIKGSCEISTDSGTTEVDLGETREDTLAGLNVGNMVQRGEFSINFTRCPAGVENVVMAMHGDSMDGRVIHNSGTASGVGMQLMTEGGTGLIDVLVDGTEMEYSVQPNQQGAAEVKYIAFVTRTTEQPPAAGTLYANLTYDVVYQ